MILRMLDEPWINENWNRAADQFGDLLLHGLQPRDGAPNMTRLEAVRLESRAFKADPFPFYRQLRADKPIAKVRLPMLGETWIVARHADVAALLKDARLVKDRANAAAPGKKLRQPALMRLLAPLMNGMLDKDDPDHARLRRLVQVAFTPKRIDAMQAAVETLAETLLDQLKGSRTFDLMEDYALRLPITVISDILGVPESTVQRLQVGRKH